MAEPVIKNTIPSSKVKDRRFKDLRGARFSRLLVQSEAGRDGQGNVVWLCLCDCGTMKKVGSAHLRKGTTSSCGCYRREILEEKKKHAFAKTPEYRLLVKAKQRSKEERVPFGITLADIVIPEKCPLLGIELIRSKTHANGNSPTLDKIIPARGYVKDNILVISHRANTIKNDASLEELELLTANLRRFF